MRWRRQIGPLICAVFILLATVAMFALKTLTPVVASRASVPSNEPNLSSQTKKLLVHPTSLEIPRPLGIRDRFGTMKLRLTISLTDGRQARSGSG